MSMLILKASAGSGKTYRLSNTYIDLLLGSKDPCPYRHILAVTFTNKATAEMKSRILRDLYNHPDPKARKMLIDILHDYSAFSVSTIDKFFQRALKAFAREIGSMDDYQIELDRQSLIQESIDRILDSLTEEDKDIIAWIKSTVVPTLDLGKKVKIEDGLYEIGKQLKNEDFRNISSKLKAADDTTDYFEKSRLSELSCACNDIISSFEKRVAPFDVVAAPGEILKFKKTQLKKQPELAAIVDEEYSDYVTAYIIKGLIFQLGLSGEFNKEFDALTREKNVMCLDESNVFLKDIIGGSDAPFVFEKLGARYDHFLLDEFQDTSIIQWENFLPLLKEADSKGSNLIVGDIKQSIYRFRDSDWKLLGNTVSEAFPRAKLESLQNNWRSAQQVVRFNNSFFQFVSKKLGLESIYADVAQTPKTKDTQSGQVRVSFTDDQLKMIYDSVVEARSAGAQWGDIAVLVRTNKIGKVVADYLIAQAVPIISDDSLDVHSSKLVRQLVSLLTSCESPEDKIGSYLSGELGVTFPKTYHSIVDLSEELLRQLAQNDPSIFEGETLYVQSFMDDMLSWTATNGNNLGQYLKYWKDKKLFISTPESSSAVRIMTVHKSKGLEFPVVIFPFAEAVNFYHTNSKWCYLSAKDTHNPRLNGLYPVELQNNVMDSAFERYRTEEEQLQLIDNMNVFYVTLTRAEKSLHIISKPPTKTFVNGLKKAKPEYKNFSQLLYEFVNQMDESRFGEEYDYTKLDRKKEQVEQEFPSCYNSTSLAGRLSPSVEPVDFFSEDGIVFPETSPRHRGIILHDILSHVNSLADVQVAVARAQRDALLSAEEAKHAYELLESRVKAHPEWFNPSVQVHSERSIFAADGSECRPDRVIVEEDGVTIIDFKFGAPEKKYLKQVDRYATLYRSMGYIVKAAVVWYVETDKSESL